MFCATHYTPLPSHGLIGIYHLLCDYCNLVFTGFVLPWTLLRVDLERWSFRAVMKSLNGPPRK
jgi:hypothetical protein